jgi:predicted nucleic acid-binding protein
VTSGLFWDASALVKAYSQEDGTPNVESAIALRDVRAFVTDFVALEVMVALGKKFRTDQMTKKAYRSAIEEFRRDFRIGFHILEVAQDTREQSHRLAEKYNRLGPCWRQRARKALASTIRRRTRIRRYAPR